MTCARFFKRRTVVQLISMGQYVLAMCLELHMKHPEKLFCEGSRFSDAVRL
jgi:hypothetical protein